MNFIFLVRALEFRSDPNAVDEGQQLREISQRKHALLEELRVYERPHAGGTEDQAERIPLEYSMVPVGTSLSTFLFSSFFNTFSNNF
uniref:Kinesin motor domain-containing protein n=1 Tax=Meloidogyne hapla TaxID=6305 RepID=A0A1I8B2D7_MELHA